MSAPPLSQFTKAMLEEYEFPGSDAAVVFVPEGESPSPEAKQVLGRSHQQRWYPVSGGHTAKVPRYCSKGSESLFVREKKGWDHEHCDFCGADVKMGELAWSVDTEAGGIWLFCRECYEQLEEK